MMGPSSDIGLRLIRCPADYRLRAGEQSVNCGARDEGPTTSFSASSFPSLINP